MKLVLAEKPSVAQSLAKVLGANKRCDGYLEGSNYIVSWCVGHLVELSPPEAYDETYAKWRLSDLPILPATWKYQVSASTRKQFGTFGFMETENLGLSQEQCRKFWEAVEQKEATLSPPSALADLQAKKEKSEKEKSSKPKTKTARKKQKKQKKEESR